MSRHVFPCTDPDCEFCEAAAERRAQPEPYDDLGGQAQYERHLDRMGGNL